MDPDEPPPSRTEGPEGGAQPGTRELHGAPAPGEERSTRPRTPRHILLVEDDEASARLILMAFKEVGTPHLVHVVEDGEQAMEFLRKAGSRTRAPRPDLVLLDLNLPRKSGLEVLREIRADPDLQVIPVVVLSSSGSNGDVDAAYSLGTNGYVQKPASWDGLQRLAASIDAFWFTFSLLPASRSGGAARTAASGAITRPSP